MPFTAKLMLPPYAGIRNWSAVVNIAVVGVSVGVDVGAAVANGTVTVVAGDWAEIASELSVTVAVIR